MSNAHGRIVGIGDSTDKFKTETQLWWNPAKAEERHIFSYVLPITFLGRRNPQDGWSQGRAAAMVVGGTIRVGQSSY